MLVYNTHLLINMHSMTHKSTNYKSSHYTLSPTSCYFLLLSFKLFL